MVKMHKANNNFKNTLEQLKSEGDSVTSRPSYTDGTQSKSLSIKQVFEKYDVRKESVIHNYRPTAIKMAIQEIFWIYQDQTSDLNKAHERGIYWWDDFNVGDDSIGWAYGHTVKRNNLIDDLLFDLENKPFSRRHIMSLWDLYHNDQQDYVGGLVPCAYETIWSVDSNYNVDLTLVQRSSDYITANVINKIQYVALGMMICGHLRYKTNKPYQLRNFAHLVQDLHIYDRHFDALEELLERTPSEEMQAIELLNDKDFYDYTIEDFKINKIKIDKIKSEERSTRVKSTFNSLSIDQIVE